MLAQICEQAGPRKRRGADVRALALVCRRLGQAAQRVLFTTIELRSPHAARQLEAVFDERPELASRFVHLARLADLNSHQQIDAVDVVVSQCLSLQSYCSETFTSHADLGTDALVLPPRLRRLELLDTTSDQLATLLTHASPAIMKVGGAAMCFPVRSSELGDLRRCSGAVVDLRLSFGELGDRALSLDEARRLAAYAASYEDTRPGDLVWGAPLGIALLIGCCSSLERVRCPSGPVTNSPSQLFIDEAPPWLVIEIVDTLASGSFPSLTSLTIVGYYCVFDERFAELMAQPASRQRYLDALQRLPPSLEHIGLRFGLYPGVYGSLEPLDDVESMAATFSAVIDVLRARIVDPDRPALASLALQRDLPTELLGHRYPPSIKTLLRALLRSLLSLELLCEAHGVDLTDGALAALHSASLTQLSLDQQLNVIDTLYKTRLCTTQAMRDGRLCVTRTVRASILPLRTGMQRLMDRLDDVRVAAETLKKRLRRVDRRV